MRLIPEARNWWKMFSMQAMALLGFINLLWVSLPVQSQEFVLNKLPSADWVNIFNIAMVAIGMLGRVVAQDSVKSNQ